MSKNRKNWPMTPLPSLTLHATYSYGVNYIQWSVLCQRFVETKSTPYYLYYLGKTFWVTGSLSHQPWEWISNFSLPQNDSLLTDPVNQAFKDLKKSLEKSVRNCAINCYIREMRSKSKMRKKDQT